MKHDILTIIALGAVLGVLLVLIFTLQSMVDVDESVFCNSSQDCTGQPHVECEGEWACRKNYCSWECNETPEPCKTAADCEGMTHVMCVGEWGCDDGQCFWSCEVGDGEVGLDYRVGECDENPSKSRGGFELSASATGINLDYTLDYVCCAEIELDSDIDGNVITIRAKNVGSMCKCMCSYDLDASISVLPGTYKVELYGVEYGEYGVEKLGEGMISVGKSEGTILFIEQHETVNGVLRGGSYPFTFVDSVLYGFNEGERLVSGVMDFNLDGLVAIYGSGVTYTGEAGSGTANQLYPVKSVPKQVSDDKITRIWEDGTVAIEHNGEMIELSPGKSWSNRTTKDDTGEYNTGLIRLTMEDTITNHGFVRAEQIEG